MTNPEQQGLHEASHEREPNRQKAEHMLTAAVEAAKRIRIPTVQVGNLCNLIKGAYEFGINMPNTLVEAERIRDTLQDETQKRRAGENIEEAKKFISVTPEEKEGPPTLEYAKSVEERIVQAQELTRIIRSGNNEAVQALGELRKILPEITPPSAKRDVLIEAVRAANTAGIAPEDFIEEAHDEAVKITSVMKRFSALLALGRRYTNEALECAKSMKNTQDRLMSFSSLMGALIKNGTPVEDLLRNITELIEKKNDAHARGGDWMFLGEQLEESGADGAEYLQKASDIWANTRDDGGQARVMTTLVEKYLFIAQNAIKRRST